MKLTRAESLSYGTNSLQTEGWESSWPGWNSRRSQRLLLHTGSTIRSGFGSPNGRLGMTERVWLGQLGDKATTHSNKQVRNEHILLCRRAEVTALPQHRGCLRFPGNIHMCSNGSCLKFRKKDCGRSAQEKWLQIMPGVREEEGNENAPQKTHHCMSRQGRAKKEQARWLRE